MTTTDKDSTGPKGERGKCLVMEAARVFWTYGIKSMTMDDMSTRLGISKKTLYQHVKDKNDLVAKVLLHIAEEFKCEIDEELEKGLNAIDELYAVTTRVAGQLKGIHPSIHFDLEKYHPEAFRHMVENKRKEIFASMTENMERGIKEGLYREDLNIPMIATIYIARFDMVFDGELFPPEQFNMDDLHWEIFRYHIRGIASAKGLKYLQKKVLKEMRPTGSGPHRNAGTASHHA
jgi:AcrR family transcriptional regulator